MNPYIFWPVLIAVCFLLGCGIATLLTRLFPGKLYTDEKEQPFCNPICIKCWSDSLFDGDSEVKGERRYKCCNCGCLFHTRVRHDTGT